MNNRAFHFVQHLGYACCQIYHCHPDRVGADELHDQWDRRPNSTARRMEATLKIVSGLCWVRVHASAPPTPHQAHSAFHVGLSLRAAWRGTTRKIGQRWRFESAGTHRCG